MAVWDGATVGLTGRGGLGVIVAAGAVGDENPDVVFCHSGGVGVAERGTGVGVGVLRRVGTIVEAGVAVIAPAVVAVGIAARAT